jgi:hypothetical protein
MNTAARRGSARRTAHIRRPCAPRAAAGAGVGHGGRPDHRWQAVAGAPDRRVAWRPSCNRRSDCWVVPAGQPPGPPDVGCRVRHGRAWRGRGERSRMGRSHFCPLSLRPCRYECRKATSCATFEPTNVASEPVPTFVVPTAA